MNLIQMARGWAVFLQGNSETQDRMMNRLAKCEECPHKQAVNSKGIVILNILKAASFRCELCKCFLSAKTADQKSKCPIGKW